MNVLTFGQDCALAPTNTGLPGLGINTQVEEDVQLCISKMSWHFWHVCTILADTELANDGPLS